MKRLTMALQTVMFPCVLEGKAMFRKSFKLIISLISLYVSLSFATAQTQKLPPCPENQWYKEWHMCHAREDLGGGLVIDADFINGTLHDPSLTPVRPEIYTAVERFNEALELGPSLNLGGANIFINFSELLFSGNSRKFKLLIDFDSKNPYRLSKRVAVDSLELEINAQCNSRKFSLDKKVIGVFGRMGNGRRIELDESSNSLSEIFNESEIKKRASEAGGGARQLGRVVSSVLNNVCAPDIADKVSLAKLNRVRLDTPSDQGRQTQVDTQVKVAQQQQSNQSTTPSAPAALVANRRALVIGNDSYIAAPKLDNAREDARTIAANLRAVGYQVTLKLDLNEKEMKSALRTFASQVQGGDEVMFFFAGHGVQLGSTNYLLPTDIVGDNEAQVRDEAIQLQRILDDMSEKKAKFTLAMIDACRDNPFKTSGRAIGGRGLAPTTAATGQMVIFSAGTGQQALDRLSATDKSKNGLFTRVFAQEMQVPNVSIDRVIKNVRNQVAELAKSVGHEQVPAIYDQVLGDFYFKK